LLDRKRVGVVFELELDAAFEASVAAFRGYSKFPSIRRDLAVVVYARMAAAKHVVDVLSDAGELLQNVGVFDEYPGTGVDSRRKSIGLGLILQDTSRTLTDADADQTMRSVTHRLERELGATIRT
jgi:phenylalanyl-tRNA synthetase beta chain